jgi:hypothetical protein
MAGAFVLVMAAHACRLLGISWAALILESLALVGDQGMGLTD